VNLLKEGAMYTKKRVVTADMKFLEKG
jgi:hypothetical protein